ncbi:hypothetical protein MARI151_10025 [Maribacter litoralis]|uniref:Uncharacterized protein n=1 Tax=Maribacter litoralis TaxID=2059726 RepID=A0A653LJZ3_9FLAO|nr:hypothetical protein MARI151_10025 [Maribacter litoralis]
MKILRKTPVVNLLNHKENREIRVTKIETETDLVVTTLEVRIIGIRADLKNVLILIEASSFC